MGDSMKYAPIYFPISSQDESMDTSSNDFRVDTNFKKLLLRVRLSMEDEFASGNAKRSVLWDKVLEKMKEENPNLNASKEQVNRKYLNLLCTYRRIKQRHKESGHNATSWEFFDDFDKIFGSRHLNNDNTYYMLPSQDESMGALLNEMKYESCDDGPESFNSSTKKKYINDILEYLEEEAVREQKRHDEILAIEEKKLEVEEKEIKAMFELKEVLEKAFEEK